MEQCLSFLIPQSCYYFINNTVAAIEECSTKKLFCKSHRKTSAMECYFQLGTATKVHCRCFLVNVRKFFKTAIFLKQLIAFNYFSKKAPSQIFDWVLNTSLYTSAKCLHQSSEVMITNREIISNNYCRKRSSMYLKQKTLVLPNCFFNFPQHFFMRMFR